MLYLPPTACSDEYSDALTLGPMFQATHANVQVGANIADTNAALYQVAHGRAGDWRWTLEREFTAIPQTFRIGGNVIGLRFRNAKPGNVATVQAYLLGPKDPSIEPGTPFGRYSIPTHTRTILGAGGIYSGTYYPPAAATLIVARCLGPGGKGGTVQTGTSSAPNVGLGGGGGGGGYAERYILGPSSAGYSYVIGTNYYTNTTLTDLATSVLVCAGYYGQSGTGTAPPGIASPTSIAGGGGGGGVGDLVIGGGHGDIGIAVSTAVKWGGAGGDGAGPFGGGGAEANYLAGSGGGNAATAYGGGGGGAVCLYGSGATIYQGGSGGHGLIVVDEFYEF